MSKYIRSAAARKRRIWYMNVGDGAKLTRENRNPNDEPAAK